MTKEQVEHLIEEIKAIHKESKEIWTSYPWEDVYASMMNEPEKVKESERMCPHCGNRQVELFFISPAWTWERLCGRAGKLWLCPKCGNQIEFNLEYMN